MEQTVSRSHLETEGRGATLKKVDLLKILKKLKTEEFKEFKFYLEDRDFMKNYRSIALADLEDADRMETVNLMVKTFTPHEAVNVTKEVLKEIPRKDLLQDLSASSSESEVSVDVEGAGGAPENRGASSSQTEALSSNHLRALDLTHDKMFPGFHLSRGELRKYSCELTVDTNTVSRKIKLSDNNRKMTLVEKDQSYPDHPERFETSTWPQLLCRTGLTGRCYWEVEWRGWVSISVSYRRISRKEASGDCWFGLNDQSWSLWCDDDGLYSVCHNNRLTPISSSSSSSGRAAVYVDCPAGTLSFYRVSSDSLIHLHTFNTTFTEPLYPGFGFLWSSSGSSVRLCGV